MIYIKRLAEDKFEQSLKNNKILIVLGARQVGKTTLIKHCLKSKKAICLNLDIESDKERFLAVAKLPPRAALSSLGTPDFVVIDEAQRLLEAGHIVKGWYDAQIPAKIIISGSSSLNLLNQASEAMTGRNEKIFLPPLTFFEVVRGQSWWSEEFSYQFANKNLAGQLKGLLMDNLVWGSYPAVASASDKKEYLLNLSSDYLWKDILQLGLVKTPAMIKKLLLLLAHQVGAEVSINELASSLAMTRQTAQRYLELLEQTFVIFPLPAFSTNPRKEISKSCKYYFWDTGIRNALLNEFSLNDYRSDIGALWENWVMAEFAKDNLLRGQPGQLYFWRSKAKSEVDLVVKDGVKLSAYEIKWKKSGQANKAFADQYGVEVKIINSQNPLFLM